MKVWIDGSIVDGSSAEARVPVTDHGFLYGDGVFEGMRVRHGRLFRLEDHLARLATGARALGIELPGGSGAMGEIALATARAFGEAEAYLRLVVSRGSGGLGVDPTPCLEPRVVCMADHIRLYPEPQRSQGIRLLTSSLRRPAPDVLDPAVKSLNYLNNALAKREARLRGGDEALLLNGAGRVAEAAVANLFVVCAGVLATPPVSEGALPGITRATLLELAAREGIAAEQRSLGRMDLFAAEEVFLSGSGAGLVPVASLDGSPVGTAGAGAGPLLSRLASLFDDFARTAGVAL